MAQILQLSTRCRTQTQPQPQSATYTPTLSVESQEHNKSLNESQMEDLGDKLIGQAYHLAGIAHARLQKEAKRHDHDLRLLVGHANLLDQLTEKIEQVEPDFTIESLELFYVEPPSHSITPSNRLRRLRIDDILCNIDLSDDEDEDVPDEEVYDESDDDEDVYEPVSPREGSFTPDKGFQMPWLEEAMVSKVNLTINQDPFDEMDHSADPPWSEHTTHRMIHRMESMPIITVTLMNDGV